MMLRIESPIPTKEPTRGIMVGDVEMPFDLYMKIADSASRGAAFLDVERPGWQDRINAEILDMTEVCHCIYGQLNASDLLDELHRGDVYGWSLPWRLFPGWKKHPTSRESGRMPSGARLKKSGCVR